MTSWMPSFFFKLHSWILTAIYFLFLLLHHDLKQFSHTIISSSHIFPANFYRWMLVLKWAQPTEGNSFIVLRRFCSQVISLSSPLQPTWLSRCPCLNNINQGKSPLCVSCTFSEGWCLLAFLSFLRSVMHSFWFAINCFSFVPNSLCFIQCCILVFPRCLAVWISYVVISTQTKRKFKKQKNISESKILVSWMESISCFWSPASNFDSSNTVFSWQAAGIEVKCFIINHNSEIPIWEDLQRTTKTCRKLILHFITKDLSWQYF